MFKDKIMTLPYFQEHLTMSKIKQKKNNYNKNNKQTNKTSRTLSNSDPLVDLSTVHALQTVIFLMFWTDLLRTNAVNQ